MAFSSLHEDLKTNILLKLPAKSLMRFRCVNKSWNSRLKSSSFITAHTQSLSNINDNGVVFVHGRRHDLCNHFWLLTQDTYNVSLQHQIPFDLANGECGLGVAGCCNGLICLYDHEDYMPSKIFIYNPSIGEHWIIPYQSTLHNDECPNEIDDQWPDDSHLFGFGYDSVNKVYKAVRVGSPYPYFVWKEGKEVQFRMVQVYTLGMNSWRKVETPIPDDVDFNGICGMYLNGAAHWLGKTLWNSYIVISFDLTKEEFQLFPLPNKVTDIGCPSVLDLTLGRRLDIHVNKGLLCVGKFELRGEDNNLYYDVWVMGKYGVEDSWSRLHCIPLPLAREFKFFILGFGMKGELFVHYQDKALIVHLDDRGTCKTVNLELDDGEQLFGVVAYKESLVSLKDHALTV